MAGLKNRVGNAVGEARGLVLGAQVLLGFQFYAAFQEGFEALTVWSQAAKLAALGLMLLAVGLLVAPTAYHRIVEQGEGAEALRGFTSRVMFWALLPFALALGLDLFVAGSSVLGRKWAVAFGFAAAAAAFFFWYLLEFYHRRARADASAPARPRGANALAPPTIVPPPIETRPEGTRPGEEGEGSTRGDLRAEGDMATGVGGRTAEPGGGPAGGVGDLGAEAGTVPLAVGEGVGAGVSVGEKVGHVLAEARVVLPGAQAFLGFQLLAALAQGFAQLPAGAKYVHLFSIMMSALTIVLLMTPAAYHRIVERGEETEQFHRFASRFVVAAMVPLALGLSGDVYVVVRRVTDSQVLSIVSGLVSLALFWELWFGLTLYRRTQRRFTD